MTPKQLTELKNNDILRQRLAKWMAYFCFRDTSKLEALHDRISNEEMKALTIDCVDNCYALVCMIFGTEGGGALIDMLKENDQVKQWNDPEMPPELIEASKLHPFLWELMERATAF
jgi:hypothetical protein